MRTSTLAIPISTFAFLIVVYNVLANWDAVTGGSGGLVSIPRTTSVESAGLWAAAAVVVALAFKWSASGYRLQATREDEVAARSLGIGVMRERLIAFALSGVLCGVGGALAVHQSGVLNPDHLLLRRDGDDADDAGRRRHPQRLRRRARGDRGGQRQRGAARLRGRRRSARRGLDRRDAGAGRDRPRPDPAGDDDRDAERAQRRPRGGRAALGPAAAAGCAPPSLPKPGGTAARAPRIERRRTASLRAEGISLAFAGLQVLRGVDLELRRGEALGLIGPNGAGKTTLVNVLSGFQAPDAGTVRLDGVDVAGRSPARLARAGLGRTFQAALPFPHLSGLESVAVGAMGVGVGRRRAVAVAAEVLGAPRPARSGRAAGRLPAARRASGCWESPAPSRPGRATCCSTSPPPG